MFFLQCPVGLANWPSCLPRGLGRVARAWRAKRCGFHQELEGPRSGASAGATEGPSQGSPARELHQRPFHPRGSLRGGKVPAAQALALQPTPVRVLRSKVRQPENGRSAGGICRNRSCCDAWPALSSPGAQGWQRKRNPFSSPVTAPYHE